MSDNSSSSVSDELSSEEGDVCVYGGHVKPYQFEPLADSDDTSSEEEAVAKDHDGLTPVVLRDRDNHTVEVKSWCTCGKCSSESLEGALEFRCCAEVAEAQGKLRFDGSIERISCVTQHEDFIAVTNKSVLDIFGQTIRDKRGRKYRRKGDKNE
eukprot:gene14631-biopygen11737